MPKNIDLYHGREAREEARGEGDEESMLFFYLRFWARMSRLIFLAFSLLIGRMMSLKY